MRYSKRLAGTGIVVVTAVVAAAALPSTRGSVQTAAAADHRGGTLITLAKSNAGTADPAINYTLQMWQIDQATYDGLVSFKKVSGAGGSTIVPDLATAIPKPTQGGKTWRFQIRKGIQYSNGVVVKPSDFVNVFERMFKVHGPTTGSFYSVIVGADKCLKTPKTCTFTKGIVANDKASTLTFHLTRGDAEFLDKLALPFAVAVPPSAPNHDVGDSALPGTGPYMITQYTPNGQMTLVRNPHFHVWSKDAQPDGYPDKIIQKFGLTVEAEITQIENGQADWTVDAPPADRLNEIGSKYASQAHINSLTADYYMALNVRIPPFNNLKARQAVNYAVDRNALVRIYGGPQLAAPSCQVLPAGFPGYERYCPYTAHPAPNGNGPWTAPDMKKAQQLIAESGTKGQKVTVVTINDDVNKALGEYFQSLLNKLGYKATLKALDNGVQYPYIQNSKNKVQMGESQWYQDYPAPSDFLNVLLGCDGFVPNSDASPNIAEFCNKQIQAEMNHALDVGITSPSEADGLWAKIDREVTDQAPWVTMFNPKLIDFVSKRVGNYTWSVQYYMILDQAWVQ